MTNTPPTENRTLSPARTAVVVVVVFVVLSAALGFATGTIKIGNTVPPVPPKSNPITVP